MTKKPFLNCLVCENALTAEANVFSYGTSYDKLIYVSYLVLSFFGLLYNLEEISFALDKLQFDRFRGCTVLLVFWNAKKT